MHGSAAGPTNGDRAGGLHCADTANGTFTDSLDHHPCLGGELAENVVRFLRTRVRSISVQGAAIDAGENGCEPEDREDDEIIPVGNAIQPAQGRVMADQFVLRRDAQGREIDIREAALGL